MVGRRRARGPPMVRHDPAVRIPVMMTPNPLDWTGKVSEKGAVPVVRTGLSNQTDRRFLPLALLRRSTFRPPGLLILFKNPWFLFRFSLLG